MKGLQYLASFNNTTSQEGCAWGVSHRLTLTEVTGAGTCLGNPPAAYKHLCNETLKSPKTAKTGYLIPDSDKWWACSTGLTPCVATSVFDGTKDYCVLVRLVPRVFYYPANTFEDEFNRHSSRYRREPISMTLAVILGLGVAAGVGTGTTALVQSSKIPQHFEELRAAIDQDLRALEQSITKLADSIISLSEVVLQNRRGLDLLFLQEGGLCAALKEQCCFYIDHSGVIKDSMAKLRERLDKRQRDREAHQNWFEGWFNYSPWFTTLISTITGPLIILLLILTFGPCILNRLLMFIRERLSITQALVLTQQYHALRDNPRESQD
ncbi:hypothetical protein ACRRTK_019847 [Alexandromys fortis]